MSFHETYKKVIESTIFKDFINDHKDAELCAGFFIIDFFGNDNKKSLDYNLGDKIFTFSLNDDDTVKLTEDKMMDMPDNTAPPKLEKINPTLVKADLDDIKAEAQIRTLDEGISSKYSKIIAVLQNLNNIQTWNLTCILDGLIILHILINAETGEIIKFERKSMMDLIRKK